MKRRLTIAISMILIAASVAAAEPQRRTVVIRDGKIVSDTGSTFHRVYIGVAPLEMSPELREHFGAPKDAGVLVQSVTENGPAAKAGLRVGDIITAIDGKTVDSAWDLSDIIGEKKNGDTVRIDVVRGRARQTLVATVEERDIALPTIRAFNMPDLEKQLNIEKQLNAAGIPGWRWRVESQEPCSDLQGKIRDLESRLKDLEKKLAK